MVCWRGELTRRRERGWKAVRTKHSRCSAVDVWVSAAMGCETERSQYNLH